MDFFEQEKDWLVALALLSVPEVRAAAGYPAQGPLTRRQIADFVGVTPDTIGEWERAALHSLRAALRRQGLLDEL